MKGFGILLIVIGLICEIIAMTMDVSVSSGYSGDRVNNLGLMNDRSNLVMGGGIAFISGIILIGFSSKSITSKNGKQCPQCAEMIRLEAKVCRFCQKEQSAESCIPIKQVERDKKAASIESRNIMEEIYNAEPAEQMFDDEKIKQIDTWFIKHGVKLIVAVITMISLYLLLTIDV